MEAQPDIEDMDACVGFSRPLPNNDSLPGTVDIYHRHLFVCGGIPSSDWPGSIEKCTDLALVDLLKALKSAKSTFPQTTVMNVTDDKPKNPEAGFDILLFPDNIRFLGINKDNVTTLISDLASTDPTTPFQSSYEKFQNDWIFVCAHNAKDRRCGFCGPKLIELFKKKLVDQQLDVNVSATTHVGGHKYAGNVIVFPPGNWYGNVCPTDVPEIIEKQILSSETIHRLWRGQMGLDKSEVLRITGKGPAASPSAVPTASLTASSILTPPVSTPPSSSTGSPSSFTPSTTPASTYTSRGVQQPIGGPSRAFVGTKPASGSGGIWSVFTARPTSTYVNAGLFLATAVALGYYHYRKTKTNN